MCQEFDPNRGIQPENGVNHPPEEESRAQENERPTECGTLPHSEPAVEATVSEASAVQESGSAAETQASASPEQPDGLFRNPFEEDPPESVAEPSPAAGPAGVPNGYGAGYPNGYPYGYPGYGQPVSGNGQPVPPPYPQQAYGQPYPPVYDGYGNAPQGGRPGAVNYGAGYPGYGAPPVQPYTYGTGAGGNPPVPPQNPQVGPPMNGQPNAKRSGSAKKTVLWMVAVLLELVLVFFAVMGIYALASGALSEDRTHERPQMSESTLPNQQTPGTSSSVENTSDVQMGITCVEMTDQVAQYYQIDRGLIVYSINADSNANQVDLQVGDVITHANGVRVTTFQELFAVLEKMKPGDEITLTVYRMDENNQPGDSFEVAFAVQKKQETTASSAAESKYPFA